MNKAYLCDVCIQVTELNIPFHRAGLNRSEEHTSELHPVPLVHVSVFVKNVIGISTEITLNL